MAPIINTFYVLAFLAFGAYPRYEMPGKIDPVVALTDDGDVYCTGFVVETGVIVTANHCVEEGLKRGDRFPHVRFRDGTTHTMFVLSHGKSEQTDWAILVGDTHGVTPLKLSKERAPSGRYCAVPGHGGGSDTQHVTLCRTGGEENGYLFLAATIIGGDSGSPVIDIDSEEVIGIVVRSAYPMPIGLAVWSTHVNEALDAALGANRNRSR